MGGFPVKNLILFLLSLLIMSAFTFSCSENESKEVGQNYLDSEKYSDFKQDTDRELKESEKANASLKMQLQQFSECNQDSRISLPAEIGNQQLLAYKESSSKACDIESDRQSLRLLGDSRFQHQTIRWIILEQQTAYRDQKLIASVFEDGQLRSFKTVGIFKKNPSEKIISVIQVRSSDNRLRIISETTRNIYYPIEQENVVTKTYEIEPNGNILKL